MLLGAFGFLSSDEVFRKGVVNAGIRDQEVSNTSFFERNSYTNSYSSRLFALQWVQDHIFKFGGDASRVTISGESAGGGSVMLLDMAFGGSLGDTLFTNTIAASPYLPMQYGYKDWVPSQSYYAFASLAGCPPFTAYGGSSQTIFECLQSKDTETLQAVNRNVSASGTYGTWGFLPVTDGVLVQQLPSQQLLQKSINGQRILVGNNANEGPAFTIQDIETEDDLVAWLQSTFPLFTNDDISKILLYYPSTNASVNPAASVYATNGETGDTALNESSVGTGQQQRANNIYAETTFVCPSYWLAEAYSDRGRASYKYQYSVPVATHGADVTAYFGPGTPNQSPDFKYAFMKIWGNFITQNDPSISDQIANGVSNSNSSEVNPASSWPAFNIYAPYQINLNETGGTEIGVPFNATFNATQYVGPGQKNSFSLVDAYSWEGGRG
jgi:carboxylesterase type B